MLFDIRPYLMPSDPFLGREREEDILRCYEEKFLLCARLRPQTIVEIGVRAGYSAAAFLAACPRAKYLGLDANNGQHGGEVGYHAWAEEMLLQKFPWATVEIRTADTQRFARLPVGVWDLVHVDGDHSYEGCGHDLRLAAAGARWLLVDDIEHLPEVRRAVRDFVKPGRREHVYLPSFRGDCLIRGNVP